MASASADRDIDGALRVRFSGGGVIRSTPLLTQFERQYAQAHGRRTSYGEALAIFTGLWQEARALNPNFPDPDWRRDIEPDLAVARVLNGLPPRS